MDHFPLIKHEIISNSQEITLGCPPNNEEESGWTTYFEDLSSYRQESFCSTNTCSSSMLSDAASLPAWKLSQSIHLIPTFSFGGSPISAKTITFKKPRRKEISHDDSLEDTASSPLNSPKVSDTKPIKKIPVGETDDFSSRLWVKEEQ